MPLTITTIPKLSRLISAAALFAALAAIAAASACAPAECTHIDDCPGGQVCSADGMCVAGGGHRILSNTTGLAPMGGVDGESDTDLPVDGTLPVEGAVATFSETGVLRGNVSWLVLPNAPADVSFDGFSLYATAPGDGGSGLLVFFVLDPAAFGSLLATPGRTYFDPNDLEAPAYAQVCTANETDQSLHYDALATVDMTVGAPDPDGAIPVEIIATNGESVLTTLLTAQLQ